MPQQEMAIPHLSKSDIETKAEEVIAFFDPNILRSPRQTPLVDFVHEMKDRFGLLFNMPSLGMSKRGTRILGRFVLEPRTILIDSSLGDSDRFPFVLGHELGHFILHRKVKLDGEPKFEDDEHGLVTGKKILKTQWDWLEWQANCFSSAILLPRKTVLQAVRQIQKQMGIVNNIGRVIVEAKDYSMRDYTQVLGELATVYGVNRTNVTYRLSELSILVDRRNKDISHISQIFNGVVGKDIPGTPLVP